MKLGEHPRRFEIIGKIFDPTRTGKLLTITNACGEQFPLQISCAIKKVSSGPEEYTTFTTTTRDTDMLVMSLNDLQADQVVCKVDWGDRSQLLYFAEMYIDPQFVRDYKIFGYPIRYAPVVSENSY